MISSPIHEPLFPLKGGHTSGVNVIAFSPTGIFLASGGEDHTLVVWSVKDGTMIQRMLVTSPVLSLAWHPGRRSTLFFGCLDGIVCVINDVSVRTTHSEGFLLCTD